MPKMKFSEMEEEFDKIREDVPVEADEYAYVDPVDWSKCGKLQVLGLVTEKYLRDYHIDERIKVTEAEAYHFVVKDVKTQDMYVIHLSESKPMSEYGGTCSRGILEIDKANRKDFKFTHVPAKETFLDGFTIDSDTLRFKQELKFATDEKGNIKKGYKGSFLKETEYSDSSTYNGEEFDREYAGFYVKNNVFICSQAGDGDLELPRGYIKVKKDLFEPVERPHQTHSVWVVEAKSEKDVARLAKELPGFSIFDATSADKLPDRINADVIVVGKYSDEYSRRKVTQHISGQPNVSLSLVRASKLAKFIAKQQAFNADRHQYTNYIHTSKIREAFKRVEQHLKGNDAPQEKKKSVKSDVSPALTGKVKDKKNSYDTH